ncbi:MAG: hypothetical protein EON53_01715 [Actinomycetales bacterium]|nr:MAG: hypothetical protein EON53_01715 [Actinomycetales bacterium]
MSAWDALLDRVDVIADARADVDDAVQAELTELLVGAMRDGTADRELDPGQAGLWLAALLRTHTEVQDAGEERSDDALSMLRVIITRWLHPGRLDQAPPTFGS